MRRVLMSALLVAFVGCEGRDPDPKPKEETPGLVEEEREVEEIELEEDTEIIPLSMIEKPPKVTKKVPPEYPEAARKANITGKVLVDVVIDKEGKVERAGNIRGPEVFHEAVKAAALQWEFESAIYEGQRVKVKISLPFAFTLKGWSPGRM